jgi:outer membrane protein insertion porin family
MPQPGPGNGPLSIATDEPRAPLPPRARRRRGRRVVRVALVLLIAGAALLGAAHLGAVRERVRRMAIDVARARLDTELAIGQLDYNLPTLTFTLRDVSAAASRTPGSPYFRADSVTIGLRAEALLGRLSFSSIDLVKPRLSFERDADGRYRLPSGPTGGSGRMPPLRIGRLHVAGLDLHVDGAPPLTIDATNVSMTLDPAASQIRGTLMALNDTRFRSPSGTVVELGVDGRLGLTPETVLIGPLSVAMGGSRVELEGKLPFAPGPARLDLSYRGRVSLADAARIWPALGVARGDVTASGSLAGPLSALVLTFDAAAGPASVRDFAVSGATAKGTIAHGAIGLASASIDVAGGTVTGTASFGIGDGEPSTAAARWSGVDLERLLQTLDAPHPFPVESSLAGQATFSWADGRVETLRIEGQVDTGATTRANAGLKTRATGDATRKPRVSVSGTAAVKVAGSQWTVDLHEQFGDASPISGRLSGALDGTSFAASTIRGHLEGTLDVADVTTALVGWPAVPDTVRKVAGWLDGTSAATAEVSGVLRDPVFAIAFDSSRLHVDGYGDGTLQVESRVDRRGADFQQLAATLVGTSVTGHGTMPFDGRSSNLPFTATVTDAAAWLEAVPARWRPSGPMAIEGTVTGQMSDLRIDGTLDTRALAWTFWTPGAITGRFSLNEDRVSFTAGVPSLNGTLQGWIGLTSPHAFDVASRVEDADLRRLANVAEALGAPGADWSGTATASAHVTGDFDSDQLTTVAIGADSLAGSIDGHQAHLLGPAAVTVSSDRFTADRLAFEVGGASVSVVGSLPPAPGRPPLHVDASGDLGEWWRAATGTLQASFDVAGTPADPHLAGSASLVNGALAFDGHPAVTEVHVRAHVADDMVELLEGRGAWTGAAIAVQGRVPVSFLLDRQAASHRYAARLRATITNLTPSALESWVGSDAASQLAGSANAELDLEATAPAIDALRGAAVLTQADTKVAGLVVHQPKPARVSIDRGRIALQDVSWSVGNRTVALGGSVDVRGAAPRLDLALRGSIDLAAARAFVPAAISGTATVDAALFGEPGHLKYSGSATLTDASLGFPKPRVAASGVSGTLTLDGQRVLVAARGHVNGGDLELSGAIPLQWPEAGALSTDTLRARATGFMLEWPDGLRNMLDADVTCQLDSEGAIIRGRISAEPGVYRRTTPPVVSLSDPATHGQLPAAAPSFFDATRLDLSIATRSPGLMDNSYARMEVDADVTVGGTIAEPSFGGRLSVREQGEVYLRGNVFKIERGSMDFKPDPAGRASLNVVASTRRSGYDITLRTSGPIDDLQVVLTSDPPLAQPDLMALITTGSTSNSMSPGEQGGSSQDMLVAAISSDILGLAGRTVGLDTVRVGQLELDLMGDDVDPQMRLTIGKSIASWLDLLLSQNLRESGFTWAVTVHPVGSVQLRFVSRDSQSRSLQAAHEIVFGGRLKRPAVAPRPKSAPSPRVASVTVSGGGLPESDVLARSRVRAGGAFDFVEWQRDRERVEQLFRERGYLQAQVSAIRDVVPGRDDAIALRYQVRRGPLTRFQIVGFLLSAPAMAAMKSAWADSVDDRFLEQDLLERARAAMVDAGYLWSDVTVAITNAPDLQEKLAEVRIAPGERAWFRHISLHGRRQLSDYEVRQWLKESGTADRAWREPAAATAALEGYYRGRGFLDVKATAARPTLDGRIADLPITVVEGPRYLVSSIDIRGTGSVGANTVGGWLRWRVGDPFSPSREDEARKRVEAGLAADGYRLARAAVTHAIDAATGRVAVAVDVQPGKRSVVSELQVVGRNRTRAAIVRRAVDMPPGSPASGTAADRAQRRLYETEAFRSVDVKVEPIDAAPAPAASSGPSEQPTRVVVSLDEAPLYRLRYGIQFTDELGLATGFDDKRFGVSAELRRRNLFGTALNAAVGGRYEQGNYSARAALTIPTSVLWPSLSTLYFKQSFSTHVGETGPVETVESALTYQERLRLGRTSEVSYGYAFTRELVRYAASMNVPGLDYTPTHRANLFAALAWDRRDSIFNATRGWFHGSSVEIGSPTLASEFSYFRYLLQQSTYRRVGPFVFAGAVRTGVLTHLSGDDGQTYSVRFRTGGDRTIRGYAQDSLTAAGNEIDSTGGRALLILNGEVRFPLWHWLKGAAFLDAGNVFDTPSHISLGDLKVGTGFGLRLDTPYALFRLDLGFPVPQGPGPLVKRWYFSIGQAF